MLGFAPSVVCRCWSSKGLQLRSSSSVLRRPGMPSPHETSIDSTKLLRASARYLSLCLPVQPIPFLYSPSSSLPYLPHLSFQQLFFSPVWVLCFPAPPRGSAKPTLPQSNLHNTSVRRNPERLPSSRCIESAQSHSARVRILRTRASDTALRRNIKGRPFWSRVWVLASIPTERNAFNG